MDLKKFDKIIEADCINTGASDLDYFGEQWLAGDRSLIIASAGYQQAARSAGIIPIPRAIAIRSIWSDIMDYIDTNLPEICAICGNEIIDDVCACH